MAREIRGTSIPETKEFAEAGEVVHSAKVDPPLLPLLSARACVCVCVCVCVCARERARVSVVVVWGTVGIICVPRVPCSWSSLQKALE